MLISAQAPDLLPQDALKQLLLIGRVVAVARHEVADAGVRGERIDVRGRHRLPEVLVLQVPLSVDNAVISLDVGKEALV